MIFKEVLLLSGTYVPLIEIKDFNALIDNKPFFVQSMKSKQQAYQKLVKLSLNDDFTRLNQLNFLYHQNCYKHITIDLSREIDTPIPQQINVIAKLDEYNGATISFIAEKQQKPVWDFSFNWLNVTEQHKQWNIKKYWIYWTKQAILKLWQENRTLSMINQMQYMMQEINSSKTQKY